ncbi:transcription factor mef2A [Pararge aegeria]|uniref:transcription factor mef2A n=1 Tax=Pararge aegeria TaxID=116150 RepID=UPI0019D170F5|nr:transcription factor mef2A [Pararge aegeria]
MDFQIILFAHFIAIVFSATLPANNGRAPYDPAELLRKVFNTNDTILPKANYGLIQFEDQISQPDYVNFEAHSNLEDNRENSHEISIENQYNKNVHNLVKFEDVTKDGSRKKKRRKRKPKQQFYGLHDSGNVPNFPYAPGYGNSPINGPYPYGVQYYKPPRPRPSLASGALTAVTGALTSIAMYDDYQCVPRLLCEAAAGGALGSSGILQTVSGLQPLLTLLSAYNGLTSNPLFVFGRAVLLGTSADSSTAACRYAYPACPTDPEQLVHYLNNHNGGFFRFFNAPQPGQQNVEQFYNQLSQNYGPFQSNQEYNQNGNPQNYGFYNNQNNQPNYGYPEPGLYSNYNQNYGLAYPYQNYNQNIRFKTSDNAYKIEKRIQNKLNTLYIDNLEDENPKWTFPERNTNYPGNHVKKEVFNSYGSDVNYNDQRIHNNDLNNRNPYHNDNRKGKTLKFPGVNNEEDYLQDNFDNNRGSFFPDNGNRQYLDYNTPSSVHNNYDKKYHDNIQYLDYNTASNNNYDTKYHDNKQYLDYNTANHNYDNRYVNNVKANPYYANQNEYYNYNNDNYINKNKYNNYNNDLRDGVQTVYVVRGNGDPNKPEIYKLRPGQSVQ